MLAELTLQSFEALVGTRFECRRPDDDTPIECELREAVAVGSEPPPEARRQPFSLLFFALVEEILPQQIYSLTHPEFPEPLSLFLVPVGQADGGLLLESIFN